MSGCRFQLRWPKMVTTLSHVSGAVLSMWHPATHVNSFILEKPSRPTTPQGHALIMSIHIWENCFPRSQVEEAGNDPREFEHRVCSLTLTLYNHRSGYRGNWAQDPWPGGLGKSRHFQIFTSQKWEENNKRDHSKHSPQNSDQTRRVRKVAAPLPLPPHLQPQPAGRMKWQRHSHLEAWP